MRDPYTQPATDEQIAAYAAKKGISAAESAAVLDKLRARQIAQRTNDPFNYGFEPPIWYVTKALMRNPCWSPMETAVIKRRVGMTPEEFAEKMRTKLGFRHPVARILIMGANRSGKTDFASKLCMQTARLDAKTICSGAQTLPTQKQNQMPRVWHYMPNDWKARNIANLKAKDAVENISFTVKNGFAGSKITFANRSILKFITYKQDVADLEGTEYDLAWADEEYGIEHYNLLTTRTASKGGVFLGTFTPLHGFTPQVATFLTDKVVSRYHTAYLRPTDGGEKLPWKELNLEKKEYEKLVAWRRDGQTGDCRVPESRPEDCFEWLFDKGDGRNPADGPRGRAFDYTPRVCVCQGGQAAAVWFYGSDNPYGLPSELIIQKMADQHAERKIYESVYGMAREIKGRLFTTFRDAVNIVSPKDIPEKLVRFMVCDPSPERNWALGWFGLDPKTQILYMYREWPGNYEIPGQGVPGPWAVLSDKNNGVNDGARGEGQVSFGFAYNHIKFEVARLEGWKNFTDWIGRGNSAAVMPEEQWDEIEEWSEVDGARERMVFRILDSRAASQSKISKNTNRTLIEDLSDYMEGWQVADGQRTEVGLNTLMNLIAEGRFKVSSACTNAIFAFQHYTGKDGQKGAMKDMVDLSRYAVMSDIWGYTWEDAHPIDAALVAKEIDSEIEERRRRQSSGMGGISVWW